jgi:hypothetical protein
VDRRHDEPQEADGASPAEGIRRLIDLLLKTTLKKGRALPKRTAFLISYCLILIAHFLFLILNRDQTPIFSYQPPQPVPGYCPLPEAGHAIRRISFS